MGNFFVANSYGIGVVLFEQYLEKLDGETFFQLLRQHFPAAFKKCKSQRNAIFAGNELNFFCFSTFQAFIFKVRDYLRKKLVNRP